MRSCDRRLCVFGHTHLPVVFQQHPEGLSGFAPQGDAELELRDRSAYLVNPGSVGQPRDGDPRAAFAMLDTETGVLSLRRVTYPVGIAQRRILDAGLPTSLANRLGIGR